LRDHDRLILGVALRTKRTKGDSIMKKRIDMKSPGVEAMMPPSAPE